MVQASIIVFCAANTPGITDAGSVTYAVSANAGLGVSSRAAAKLVVARAEAACRAACLIPGRQHGDYQSQCRMHMKATKNRSKRVWVRWLESGDRL